MYSSGNMPFNSPGGRTVQWGAERGSRCLTLVRVWDSVLRTGLARLYT